jgi:hypothetical protein
MFLKRGIPVPKRIGITDMIISSTTLCFRNDEMISAPPTNQIFSPALGKPSFTNFSTSDTNSVFSSLF